MFVEMETAQVTADSIISAFAAEDKQTRDLVKDLHRPRPVIYWSDLIVTSARTGAGIENLRAAIARLLAERAR